MGVEIHFLGALLFVGDGDNIREVLIPNGSVDPDWTLPNEGKKHPDNSQATPHFAGLGVIRGHSRDEACFALLHGKEVTIHEGQATPISPGVREQLPDLSGLPLQPTPNSLATRVRVGSATSATMSGDPADRAFTFDGQSNLILGLKLSYAEPRISITVADAHGSKQVDVVEGDFVAVYNYDSRFPSMEELMRRERPICENNVAYDHDFKWIYSLFAPDLELRVPKADCDRLEAATPFVSSCFSAYWSGVDESERS